VRRNPSILEQKVPVYRGILFYFDTTVRLLAKNKTAHAIKTWRYFQVFFVCIRSLFVYISRAMISILSMQLSQPIPGITMRTYRSDRRNKSEGKRRNKFLLCKSCQLCWIISGWILSKDCRKTHRATIPLKSLA